MTEKGEKRREEKEKGKEKWTTALFIEHTVVDCSMKRNRIIERCSSSLQVSK